MSARLHEFKDGAALAEALADRVSAALADAVAARGKATIAVSGGSTPKAFFKSLSTRDIDWAKVTITLVDERFVPADNPRSNHLLVAENLLQGKAQAANFLPLYRQADSADEAAKIVSRDADALGAPFDVVILGMGTDGHTASFFPGGSNLATAISAETPRGVITMEAEGAGETRLTFTFASLQDARLLVLHIEGQGKKDVLAAAEGDGPETDMPIRAVLRRAATPVDIYWAP
ncbi:6-phosphogluconolactonase [Shinella sumterensis]|jgi:6-phosphogluconolactonase|uniref:6-phosphogluconolactonase n=1 Tax=Shinella sumterensis TaxID=1967501 RepID=UPI00106ECE9B|nr:6-phosphogluconolactonase [Shinella sumterensis]MCD1265916.1 6-phosphogluconolactonase [Shinella sumterensis]MDP9590470.1 6-phosphogluconolactonase [Shinella zoogloeoides]TFE97886.1 6-phosphogluconolactonase [Shinella sumterensis]